MAHFAKLGINGKIISVLTLNNSDMLNGDDVEDESVGQQYLERHNNWPSQLWIQTSYNTQNGIHKLGGTPFRGNYAAMGYTWDEDDQIFWPPKPYPSFVKNITHAKWDSPLGDPPALTSEQAEAKSYYGWNESGQSWDLKSWQ
jgi:hypothetical protein|tara:strand:- start:840 stop:1268 length:429 start_codon:yes stop_codon:yes gene_type:complete